MLNVMLLLLFFLLSAAISSAVLHSPLTANLTAIHSGLQVILPGHQFKQAGSMKSISVQVLGPSSPLALQIWRPTSEGNYNLHWDTTFMKNPVTVTRVGSEINYQDPIGVPVRRGDVLGLYIFPHAAPISVVYYKGLELEEGLSNKVHYMEGVENPLCQLSLCNASMKAVSDGLPSIQTYGMFFT